MTDTSQASSEFSKHIKDVGRSIEDSAGSGSDMADRASAYMKDANERVSDLAGQAGDYYQQGQRAAVDAMKSQPLAALGIAALLGFVIGLLIAR